MSALPILYLQGRGDVLYKRAKLMCPYDNTSCCAGDLDPHYFAPRRQLNKAQAVSVIVKQEAKHCGGAQRL